MTKTVLVTGAEGFIGSHLVKFLQTKAWRVIGTYQGNGTNSFLTLALTKGYKTDFF
jgi:nucleoside-diphosphate-sugar epimerase